MRTKKVIMYVLPPLFFLGFGIAFKLIWDDIFGFNNLKYISYGRDLFVSFLFGSIASVLYLAALLFTSNTKKSAFRLISWILIAVLIIAVIMFEFFAFVVLAGTESKTDNEEHYLLFDDCGLDKNEYFKFLPPQIPENADNIVYSYRCLDTIFGGAYAYAEWTLPDEEYNEEKQRLIDLLYPRIPYEIDGETVYANSYSTAGEAQISFNDDKNKVSYYISVGEELGNKWKKEVVE